MIHQSLVPSSSKSYKCTVVSSPARHKTKTTAKEFYGALKAKASKFQFMKYLHFSNPLSAQHSSQRKTATQPGCPVYLIPGFSSRCGSLPLSGLCVLVLCSTNLAIKLNLRSEAGRCNFMYMLFCEGLSRCYRSYRFQVTVCPVCDQSFHHEKN